MKKISRYVTCHDYGRDMGKRLGYEPLYRQWLQVKLRVHLPCDESHMQSLLQRILE